MLKQFERPRLYEAVAKELKTFILDGGLKPGDQLPTEQELCQRLNVGRATLREAMRQLQMLGLVESKAGRGTYVCGEARDSDLTRLLV